MVHRKICLSNLKFDQKLNKIWSGKFPPETKPEFDGTIRPKGSLLTTLVKSFS